jgi:FMN hydrolase / 5-amino-6-(5-phospho-D-ribitylamino)uracil phosphatase
MQAVLFDGDQTLWDFQRVMRDALIATAAELRVHGFTRTLQRRRAAEGGDEAADEVLARQLSDSYFAHRDRDAALFPDTIPGLDALRDDYRLGLLSNGSRLPERVGLAGYFETVVFAQDHRVAKPDKGIFEVVERELGVGPEVCVLVGDHPVNDVAGAHGAGWRSVWIDRNGAVPFPGDGPSPDAAVRTLTELPGVLRRLG